jgi:hypothetical protein
MRSRLGYVLAAICLAVGAAVAGCLAWSEVGALQNAMIRFVVPGSTEMTLSEPGTYTIYHEAESVIDGQLYAAPNIGGLKVSVTAESGGKTIPVVTPSINSNYTIGGHSGVSVFAFDIAQPGRYRLTAAYAGGQTSPQTVLAVSTGFVWGLVRTILGAIAAVFAGFGGALAFALTTYFRRRRMQQTAGVGLP